MYNLTNMKKTIIYLFALCFTPTLALTQLDIEAFKTELTDYVVVDSVSKESMTTLTFSSRDSTNIFEVNYDSDGEIINDEWWDIAITNRKLDSKGREIEFAQYEKDGTLAERDTPPIIETIYNDSDAIKRTNYLKGDRSIESSSVKKYDTKGREIEMRWFDGKNKLERITTYEFDDENHSRTEKQFDSKSIIETDGCGVAIKVIKFPESGYLDDRTTWVEEKYFNKNLKLVDCTHNYLNDKPFSIIQRTKLNENKFRFVLLNAKGEIINDEIVELE